MLTVTSFEVDRHRLRMLVVADLLGGTLVIPNATLVALATLEPLRGKVLAPAATTDEARALWEFSPGGHRTGDLDVQARAGLAAWSAGAQSDGARAKVFVSASGGGGEAYVTLKWIDLAASDAAVARSME